MDSSSKFGTMRAFGAFVVAGLAICISLMLAAPAYAVTAAEKQAEAQEALNQLYAMQSSLEETSEKYYKSLSEYQVAKDKCDAAQARIDQISGEITVIQGRLGQRAREMYRTGSSSFIDLLLGAATFDEFSNNWDLLNRVNETDARLSAQARALREENEKQKAKFDEQAAIAEQKSKDASSAFKESQKLVEQMEETYNSLSKEAAELYRQEQEAAALAAAQAAAAQAAAAEQAAYAGGGEGGGEAGVAAQAEMPTEGGMQNDDGTVTDVATGQTYSSPSEYSAATGNTVVDRAMSMLGASYKYGSTGSDGSFDCSGLVGYALTGSYERIGNTTTFMGYNQVSDPQPGDVVVSEGHTGIYIGDGQMIHAADENTGVVVGNVQSDMIYVRP